MTIFRTATAVILLALPILTFAGPVNVNTADAQTISEELTGIGMSKARAIVEYRKKHGPFKNADELSLVNGIGERTVDRNRADIQVSAPKKK